MIAEFEWKANIGWIRSVEVETTIDEEHSKIVKNAGFRCIFVQVFERLGIVSGSCSAKQDVISHDL